MPYCCRKEEKFNEATGLNYYNFDDFCESNFSQATGIETSFQQVEEQIGGKEGKRKSLDDFSSPGSEAKIAKAESGLKGKYN